MTTLFVPVTRQRLERALGNFPDIIRAWEQLQLLVGGANAGEALSIAQQAATDILALKARLDVAEAAVTSLYAADTALDARLDIAEAALAELNMQYATRLDNDASPPTVSYFGIAATGSTEGDAVWRISKTVYGAIDGDESTTWADGNSNFDNVWTNRAALSYS